MNFSVGKINTFSNYISIVRIFLAVPLLILLNSYEVYDMYRTLIIAILLFAFITDISDGYIARKRNEITEFGKIIDPLADKVLIFIVVIKLYLLSEIPGYIFWIIIIRDLLILLGGIYVSKKLGRVLPSNLLGKATVIIIGIFILSIIGGIDKDIWFYKYLLYLCIMFSFISIIGYLIRSMEAINWGKNEYTKIDKLYKN